METRTRSGDQAPQNGGQACPALTESRACASAECAASTVECSCSTADFDLCGRSDADALLSLSELTDVQSELAPVSCTASSGSSSANLCDGDTGTTWVSADNADLAALTISFAFSVPTKINTLGVYVNDPLYVSTLQTIKLQYRDAVDQFVDVGTFTVQRIQGPACILLTEFIHGNSGILRFSAERKESNAIDCMATITFHT